MKMKKVHLVAITAVLAASTAMAKSSSVAGAGSETISETSFFSDKLIANYFGIFSGPSLGKSGMYQTTGYGDLDPTSPQQLEGYLTVGYKVSDSRMAGIVLDLIYKPFYGQDLQMEDPALKIGDSKFISFGGFSDSADLRLFAPTGRDPKIVNEVTAIQTLHVMSYQIHQSRLSIGSVAAAKVSFFRGNGSGKSTQLYLGPNVSYQLSRGLSATLLYEMCARHDYGSNDFFDLTRDGTDLRPGFNWDITPNFNINPFVNLQTGNKVNLDTTTFGFFASAKLI